MKKISLAFIIFFSCNINSDSDNSDIKYKIDANHKYSDTARFINEMIYEISQDPIIITYEKIKEKIWKEQFLTNQETEKKYEKSKVKYLKSLYLYYNHSYKEANEIIESLKNSGESDYIHFTSGLIKKELGEKVKSLIDFYHALVVNPQYQYYSLYASIMKLSLNDTLGSCMLYREYKAISDNKIDSLEVICKDR